MNISPYDFTVTINSVQKILPCFCSGGVKKDIVIVTNRFALLAPHDAVTITIVLVLFW
jgi:hypothetical protein